MMTTAEDASNNNDGADASVFGHSLDGRLSRPTSAWKSQRRRPKFTSLDGDDLDLEVLDLDDGDSSDDNADLVDLRDVVGQNRSTGNGRPFQSVTRKETDLVVPVDWISKSSPRTPRAWQEGNDLAEFKARSIRNPLVRRGSGESNASECDSNSSTDTLGSGKARRNSYETKLSGAERRFDARPRDFKELQNEMASSGKVCVGGRMVERYRTGECREDGNFPSKGGGDAFLPVGQTHDVKYPTRPSLPRETKQLAYSHLRQKLQPIERRIEVPVEVDDGDVKSRRRTRLRPLMTKRARALIFGLGHTDDKMGAAAFTCVTENVTAAERVNGASRRATKGILGTSELGNAAEPDRRSLEGVMGELRSEMDVKPGIDRANLTSLNESIEASVASEDAPPTPRMRDGVFYQDVENYPLKMGRSIKAPNVSTFDPEERMARCLKIGEDQKIAQHEANNRVKTEEVVRRNSVERTTPGSEVISSRDGIGIRPKFVGPECFENSTTLTRSWKSPDLASMYPAPGARKTSSSPGHLFYATHYSQFLPNDLNLEEFSLFDGEFTRSYRPSSPEPYEDALERPEARIPDAAEALSARSTAPTLTVPTLRVSTASSITATPSEEDEYLAAPSPSIALSLSLSASMIPDDDELATDRSGAPLSRMNSDRRRLESATVPPSASEDFKTPSTVQVVTPLPSTVGAPRTSREGPVISRSLVRSVSFAEEPIMVPQIRMEDRSVAEQSDLSPSARSLALAHSEPPPAFSALSLVPSPPKLAPSRPLAVASPRAVAATTTRQSPRVPAETLSSTPSKATSRIHFSPSETLPLAPSKVPLITHFTPPESMFSAPTKVPTKTQSIPSETAPLATQTPSLVPSYASLKSEGLTFNNSAMYSPWGQQSLADMWNEAQKGLGQTNDKTSFL